MLFSGIGYSGQQRLAESTVLLVGCGALGCVLADSMVRAGVGCVRLVDRDFVELSNLQRQILFTEADVHEQLPKAVAAERRLRQINSEVRIEAVVADVDYAGVTELAKDASLILDGTDNFEVRYLINDVSLELNIPWIFTGCTGSAGQVMPVFPHRSACLRCLMPFPPPPGSTETCDTAGVLGPAVSVMASLQAAIAIRILAGHADDVPHRLHVVDVWDTSFRSVDLGPLRAGRTCPACDAGERAWLKGQFRSTSTILCGRNAVQITPPEKLQLSLDELTERLRASGDVTANSFLVRVTLPGWNDRDSMELTIFPDGRAIVRGTDDPAVARSVYSRCVGL